MTSLQDFNLDDLLADYAHDLYIAQATAFVATRSAPRIAWLLRHHDEEDINDRETRLRDGVDQRLECYSIIEIASMVGYVPDPLPRLYRQEAAAFLEQPAVARYYTTHYPLLLPQAHRSRLAGGYRARIKPKIGIPLFNGFLAINETIARDDEVDTFLWFLEAGVIDGFTLEDSLRVLGDHAGFARAMRVPAHEQTAAEDALHGLRKFLFFSQELHTFLLTAADAPLLQSACYHYHAYWYRHIQQLGPYLHRAIDRFLTWEARASRASAVAARQLHATISALTSKKYATVLESFVRPYRVDVPVERPRAARNTPMTRADVIAYIAAEAAVPPRAAATMLEALNTVAYREAKKGFTLPGLGKLVLVSRKARMGRNPATGAAIKIPAKTVLKFRVAKAAKDAIRNTKK